MTPEMAPAIGARTNSPVHLNEHGVVDIGAERSNNGWQTWQIGDSLLHGGP